MAEFTITLTGNATGDDVRGVFEDAVRGLRAVLAEFDGTLESDGVTESADDVSDEPPAEGDEDDQTADEDATEEAAEETTEETN